MAKARFTKGQTVYQIHTCWSRESDYANDTTTEYMKITEEVVESCGQKRMLLYDDSHRGWKQFRPDQGQGFCSRLCVTFHATLEEAEKEMESYMEFHNGRKQGTMTLFFKAMK